MWGEKNSNSSERFGNNYYPQNHPHPPPPPTNVQWSCQPFRGWGKKRIWHLSECHPSSIQLTWVDPRSSFCYANCFLELTYGFLKKLSYLSVRLFIYNREIFRNTSDFSPRNRNLYIAAIEETYNFTIFQFRSVCGKFFLNHLAPPSINMDVKISFLDLEFMLLLLNLIAFIVSIETEASLLALAKSIYYSDRRGHCMLCISGSHLNESRMKEYGKQMLTIMKPTSGSKYETESWDRGTDNCSPGPEPP